ncbi:MAG: S8 family serine peptidase [Bacteroidales bacterium]|nr:S8 family serine peptidase [Bacteroidales bacterium]
MKKAMKNKIEIIIGTIIIVVSHAVTGQSDAKLSIDSIKTDHVNWYNLDVKQDKVIGVSTEKAYSELLTNKTPEKTIVVAVIDAGVDINHEDLHGKIWKNLDEVPENGIDDDNNGYIDDVYGWGFLGNSNGENIQLENMEYTRIYKKYNSEYGNIKNTSSLTTDQKKEYDYYISAKREQEKNLIKKKEEAASLSIMKGNIAKIEEILKKETGAAKLTEEIVKSIHSKNKQVKHARKVMLYLYSVDYSSSSLEEYKKEIQKFIDYRLNPEFTPREIIGDNVEVFDDMTYGNPDVTGPDASHGTMVSGLIAAVRNNGIGINGVADSVKIMAIRTIPDGDEYDKDVAHAIIYAVDNGANIINMSFGKQFSPQKQFVDEAIKYADAHNVLMIHAAGNDGINNDSITHYPHFVYNDGAKAQAFINVGASTRDGEKMLAASFSNYGKTTVDIFAPGHNIAAIYPGNKYSSASGTSFAAPIMSGIAALVWSYYPNLTALELKEILLASASSYATQKVEKPQPDDYEGKTVKVKFGELSSTGGIINVYNALKLAEERTKAK